MQRENINRLCSIFSNVAEQHIAAEIKEEALCINQSINSSCSSSPQQEVAVTYSKNTIKVSVTIGTLSVLHINIQAKSLSVVSPSLSWPSAWSFTTHLFLKLSSHQPLLQHFLNLFPCLLYTSPSPRDRQKSRMPSSA